MFSARANATLRVLALSAFSPEGRSAKRSSDPQLCVHPWSVMRRVRERHRRPDFFARVASSRSVFVPRIKGSLLRSQAAVKQTLSSSAGCQATLASPHNMACTETCALATPGSDLDAGGGAVAPVLVAPGLSDQNYADQCRWIMRQCETILRLKTTPVSAVADRQ